MKRIEAYAAEDGEVFATREETVAHEVTLLITGAMGPGLSHPDENARIARKLVELPYRTKLITILNQLA